MSGISNFSSTMLSDLGLPRLKEELNRRGMNVYTVAETVGVSGRGKDGGMLSGYVEQPLFGLSVYDRIMIAQRCDAVLGVIAGRTSRISGLEWSIIKESKEQDRIEAYLKACKANHAEREGYHNIAEVVFKAQMVRNIKRYLPDVLSDLSNFSGALLRWGKGLQRKTDDESTMIEDWLHQPNAQDTFEDFIKKWVDSLMVHGSAGLYKEQINGTLENVYVLPGGSVTPLRDRYVGAHQMFAQALPGMDPKIYFSDEISFSTYMPTSGVGYGYIPLEALVNKVAESLLFDQKAAEAADGTKPPEKVVLFGENSPFGDLTADEGITVPLSQDDQSRLEVILNEPRKNALRVLSGYGTPAVLDLSRADTFQFQSQRQKDIREAVALVYQMTNMEINASGSDDTSGRSTSEAQASIEKEKGIYPLVKIIENKLNYDILTLRFGSGYRFTFKSGLTDEQQIDLDTKMAQSMTYSTNEVRIKRGDEPWGPEFDRPANGGQAQAPDGSPQRPLNIRGS